MRHKREGGEERGGKDARGGRRGGKDGFSCREREGQSVRGGVKRETDFETRRIFSLANTGEATEHASERRGQREREVKPEKEGD